MTEGPTRAISVRRPRWADLNWSTMIKDACGTPSTATRVTSPRTSRGSINHPCAAGRIRGSFAEQPRPPRRPAEFNDEIVPVTIKSRKGDIIVSADEYPRHGATVTRCQLKPLREGRYCHRRQRVRHHDGAAVVVLMTAKQAAKGRQEGLAASCGARPASIPRSGHRTIPASRRAEEGRLEHRRSRSDRGQ